MGALRDRMETDLKLLGRAENTQRCYLSCAGQFAKHYDRPPGQMGEREIKEYLIHLIDEKEVSPATHYMHVASLRFLYGVTLRRPELAARVPFPKVPLRLPEILAGTEALRLISCVTSIKCRTIAAGAYGAGLRVDEGCRLRPEDIDSGRGLIHVRQGKGRKDREVMLGQELLSRLREYWRVVRPQGEWLFPSPTVPGNHLNVRTVRGALHKAAQAARIKKRVTPHLLRHSFATHLLEMGYDVAVIQALLGHSSIKTTRRYTRMRSEFLRQIKSPLDVAGTPEGEALR